MVKNTLFHLIRYAWWPPKDGILPIDDPQFVKVQGYDFLKDFDVVMSLEINGEPKAYSLFILVWHEIVNDTVGNTPVSVTYCILCYTKVFERMIDENVFEFGTLGKLLGKRKRMNIISVLLYIVNSLKT